MTTLVFSDTHFSPRFEPKLLRAIVRQIEVVDRVVINGDFWDHYLCSFDEFLKSPWQQLFPLLKKKQAIYIYGNHDPAEKSDRRVDMFSRIQAEKYVLKSGGKSILCTHGHRQAPEFEARHPFLVKYLFKLYPVIDAAEGWSGSLGELKRWYRRQNDAKMWQQILTAAPTLVDKKSFAIVGHVHTQLKDEGLGIYCVGASRYGELNYLLVEGGKISSYAQKY